MSISTGATGSSREPSLFVFRFYCYAKVSVSMLFIEYGVWISFADREFEVVVKSLGSTPVEIHAHDVEMICFVWIGFGISRILFRGFMRSSS